jgi:crossover junction endodeoxyribonuclease RuvC
MFALGVDPGLTRCGYAVLEHDHGVVEIVDAGVIETPRTSATSLRLHELYCELVGVLESYPVEVVVVERVLFQNNARTAMATGQSSGAALIAAAGRGLPVVQVSSNEMKLSLVGDGSATKRQLQSMIQRLLRLETLPEPPDVVDAIGLAYTYLTASPMARAEWVPA